MGLVDAETLRGSAPVAVDGDSGDREILTAVDRESPTTRPK